MASLPDLTDDDQATLIQSAVSAFYQPTSPSDLSLEAQALSAVTSHLNQTTAVDQAIVDSVEQLMDYSSNILDQIPSDVIDYLIGSLSNIVDQENLPSTIATQVQQVIQQLLTDSITGLPCNDHVQFDSDNIHASVVVLCDAPDPVIPFCPSGLNCSVTVPSWFYNETISHNGSTINVTVVADANNTVHLNFTSNQFGASLPTGGRFNITFTPPSVGSSSNSVGQCSSSDDGGQSWDSDACETVDSDTDAGTVTCSCSRSTQVQAHFVSIGNLELDSSESVNEISLIKIVIPVVGGFILIALTVFLVVLVQRRKRMRIGMLEQRSSMSLPAPVNPSKPKAVKQPKPKDRELLSAPPHKSWTDNRIFTPPSGVGSSTDSPTTALLKPEHVYINKFSSIDKH